MPPGATDPAHGARAADECWKDLSPRTFSRSRRSVPIRVHDWSSHRPAHRLGGQPTGTLGSPARVAQLDRATAF
jgi:hypothetical protein